DLDPAGRAAGGQCRGADAAAVRRRDRRALRRPADRISAGGMRRRVPIAVVAVLAIAAAAVITVSVMPRPSRVLPTPAPSAPAPPAAGPLAAGPVRAPLTGALLGAWVRPESLTQAGRLDALTSWEKLVGRRMDAVNTYRRFDQNFFESSDRAVAA